MCGLHYVLAYSTVQTEETTMHLSHRTPEPLCNREGETTNSVATFLTAEAPCQTCADRALSMGLLNPVQWTGVAVSNGRNVAPTPVGYRADGMSIPGTARFK